MRCPQCQTENPPQAKFCLECATPLAQTCANCGTKLPPAAKFCLECAHPTGGRAAPQARFPSPDAYTPKHLAEKMLGSKSALEGERKQVTVLFADLKGSMELLADRDPEEARKILDPVLELMMDLGPGKLYRRIGRPLEARPHLTTAVAMLREMGMSHWVSEAEAELAQAQSTGHCG